MLPFHWVLFDGHMKRFLLEIYDISPGSSPTSLRKRWFLVFKSLVFNLPEKMGFGSIYAG